MTTEEKDHSSWDTLIQDEECLVYLIRNGLSNHQEMFYCVEFLPFAYEQYNMFGKKVRSARKVYVVGDKGSSHTYGGTKHYMQGWDVDGGDQLLVAKQGLEQLIDHPFNSCIANEYATGDEYISFHNDKQIEGPRKAVVTVSLGGTRTFYMKHNATGKEIPILLHSGDILVMEGETQRYWTHGIKKERGVAKRISLTYRYVDHS